MKTEYSTLELRVHRSVQVPDAQHMRELVEEWGMNVAAQESVWVITYDPMRNLRRVIEVARGSYHEVDISIPAVMTAVLASGVDRFMVVHNHPASGTILPSVGDMDMTAKIMKAANTCGLRFDDHIIVGPDETYFSLTENGYIIPAASKPQAQVAAQAIRAKPSAQRFLHRGCA